jgi:protein-tyrosine phosphatase
VIDLHCHILPGLDDGALDLADSLALARQAQDDGIAVVCATPHIRHDHVVRSEELAERAAAVQEHVRAHGVKLRVVPGGELAQSEADRLDDAALRRVSLGGAGGWVLLEPAPGPLGEELHELVGRLDGRGVGTVIAHPERHAGVDFEERLRRFVADGCLIQWTAAFVADPSVWGLVAEMARAGLVHLLGSDAHSARVGRPLRLAAGFARLAEVCAPERIAWMAQEAPRAVLRGERFRPPPV